MRSRRRSTAIPTIALQIRPMTSSVVSSGSTFRTMVGDTAPRPSRRPGHAGPAVVDGRVRPFVGVGHGAPMRNLHGPRDVLVVVDVVGAEAHDVPVVRPAASAANVPARTWSACGCTPSPSAVSRCPPAGERGDHQQLDDRERGRWRADPSGALEDGGPHGEAEPSRQQAEKQIEQRMLESATRRRPRAPAAAHDAAAVARHSSAAARRGGVSGRRGRSRLPRRRRSAIRTRRSWSTSFTRNLRAGARPATPRSRLRDDVSRPRLAAGWLSERSACRRWSGAAGGRRRR